GLKVKEILDRLRRLASNEVPPNVLREVEEWGDWVRTAQTEVLTVIRCGDRLTADRVLSALGKQGERLTDTMVAIAKDRITGAERAKLQDQGIIPESAADKPAASKPKKKAKRRRYGYS